MKSVSRAPRGLCSCGVSAKSSMTTSTLQFLHFQLLGHLRDLALLLDDAPQRRLVPLVPIGLLPLCVHPQVLLDVLLDGDPTVVDVDTRAEDVNSLKDAAILLQNQADQSHGFARF